MVFIRRSRPRRGRKSNIRRRRNPRMARARMFNPAPVFTESYVLSAQIVPNTGGVLKFNMSDVPQLAQYNTLYQKYRILKARVILLPQYTGQEQNSAEYNASSNIYAHGMGRLVWAQNDSPNAPVPASESDVLKDNGCKIVPVRTKVNMGCKPVPGTKDAQGVEMTFKQKYINFVQSGSNIDHFGITFWYSQPFVGVTPSTNNDLWIYVKLTFQLSDPR